MPILQTFDLLSAKKGSLILSLLGYCYLSVATSLAYGQEADVVRPSYSSVAENTYPDRVYWGDTHVHTSRSMDGYGANKNFTPAEAYRFARGEPIIAHNDMEVRLRRPLDFLVVADHAYNMGVPLRIDEYSELLESEEGIDLLARYLAARKAGESARVGFRGVNWFGNTEIRDRAFRKSIWHEVADYADHFNDPGKFTALIGFEWTSESIRGGVMNNLHRVVIFKDDASKAKQVLPFTMGDSVDPEDLWSYMENYELETGGQILAIPHNANLSYGQMFALVDVKGRPLSVEYATSRSRWEPLLEITQIKGDSETHPLLSPTDEFANFETWNSWPRDVVPRGLDKPQDEWSAEEKAKKKNEYARSALQQGLKQKATIGVNPFKFGVIGSTDAHTGLSAASENEFWGKSARDEPSADRLSSEGLGGWPMNAAGYAAVWARENTRESLFAAMKRKEVYASTGSRMTVRFFGGWEYTEADALRPDIGRIGYAGGVPMGGDLTDSPQGMAPRFLIRAVRDPDGANLDRVQVIKGWRDEKGDLRERIYNVALSDGREEDQNGNVDPIGSTVDVADASYSNAIGDPELATVWEDPDFNRDELAFYYLRIIEIPTPRWTAYDAKFFELKDVEKEIPMVTQERAYTSPIWYTP